MQVRDFMNQAQLEKMPTKRLLSMYRSLRDSLFLPANIDAWKDIPMKLERLDGKHTFYDMCCEYRDQMKEILNRREHVG